MNHDTTAPYGAPQPQRRHLIADIILHSPLATYQLNQALTPNSDTQHEFTRTTVFVLTAGKP